MATRSKKIVLDCCRLLLDSTALEQSGENHTSTLIANSITLDNYPTRHVIAQGTVEVSFPNSDQPTLALGPGDIFPNGEISATVFQTKALSDDAIYYCVLPSTNERITIFRQDLEPGQSINILLTQVGFVYGSEFLVNDNTRNGLAVVACETQSAVITATQPCAVIIMQSSFYNS